MINLVEYQKLNNSFRNELIFHVGATSGFYSEFNNMVLAMIYCLQWRIKFSLYSEDANFRYDKGWNDYFLPFCKEVKGGFHHKYNLRDEDPMFVMHRFFERLRLAAYRIGHRHTYLTYDLFFRFRAVFFERMCFSVPELGIKDSDLRSVARDIVNMIYCFNPEITQDIHKNIELLKLPDQYIGFHIRGGDKFVEHRLEDYKKYIMKAEEVSSLRNAYVFTDEYEIVEKMRRDYPEWTFYTLTEPREKGYFHQDFLKLEPQERKRNMVKMFSSMEILKNSALFVGTFSSNPGMFLGMCMDQAYGVDYDHWLLW